MLHDDAVAALVGSDAVIEATGLFTLNTRKALRFYAGSTTAVGTAAARLGLRHVLLSIVGCDRSDLQGYGIFAAKAEQERVARRISADTVIVRSTQWFEFAQQNAERFRAGPLVLVPAMRIQPIALDAVAAVLADAALGRRTERDIQITGPDRTTLLAMSRALLRSGNGHPVPVPLPGRYGSGFRTGRLLPDPSAEVHGPDFRTWLHARA
ncbi:NADH(P)-binding protein [Amnibacterium kyonggiense]|uniref:NADH(P)-binding protein n=1 Tax=Amnibacterium kyonggiense TaxID=595671 RepID=UPI001061C04A|nr:NADH(P)-binding protein [Amnibacterium kyonggiense]